MSCISNYSDRLLLLAAFLFPVLLFAERPNVLFIAVDDLRPELGIYGSRAVTPNIDRLAESGLQFNRAYCNQAVCGASRLSLMTGLYPEYTQERSFHVRDWRQRHPDLVTMNQLFKRNGYATVGVGKIYHAWDGADTDLDNWDHWVPTQGSKYADPETVELGKQQAAAFGKEFKRGPTTEAGKADDAADRYFDGFRVAAGVRQLGKLAGGDQPFFLAVGFSKPHLPFTAPDEFWDLYERDSFSMPDNLGIPPGYPEHAANQRAGEMRYYSDVPPASDGSPEPNPKEFSEAMNKRLIHGYHASVSYTDYNVGKLLDALKESGAAENTIVVLWGDHGWKLGDHSSWCKHTNFECDTRVPLIVACPKLGTARGKTNAIVELIDLYPTLAELCGLQAPAHLQGKSLVPILENPRSAHRRFAYSSYPRRPHDDIIGHSIRSARYRYTEWWDAETDEVLDRVLTDLIQDPGETTNALPQKGELADKFSDSLKVIVKQARTLPHKHTDDGADLCCP
ncbi:iduronate-2-sulfatase [Coraliomargarita sinensis]|uniref:Iduronate-2-sulfatase n=1 Tax=Coraliomargarita sinensis TaxID=2174842 RepID=A0A317ZH31_9BACT|nr:sulfatase [Coraliomargarita sinensis]PXA03533.1 iduronate-2-sulfatase [Coraliomargarita sinensis]